ncbi:unnamed protein product [Closterium sp. Naga37s-1]|nr:unnamed protein product [Closterium sp. Naga37s-1]
MFRQTTQVVDRTWKKGWGKAYVLVGVLYVDWVVAFALLSAVTSCFITLLRLALSVRAGAAGAGRMGRLGSAPGLGLLGKGERLGAVATVGEVMVGGSSTGEEVQGVVPWHMREARPGVLELNPGNLHAALRHRSAGAQPWQPACSPSTQANVPDVLCAVVSALQAHGASMGQPELNQPPLTPSLPLRPFPPSCLLPFRPTFLMFYAPWCPHCKRMEQAWADLAARLKDLDFNVQVARVDAYRYPQLAEEFQIPGFPTLVLFDGERALGMHRGKRDVDTIVGFVDATLPRSGSSPHSCCLTGRGRWTCTGGGGTLTRSWDSLMLRCRDGLSEEFQIPGFPTLVLFDAARALGMHRGKRDVNTLVGFVDATLP